MISLILVSCDPEVENYIVTFNANGGAGEMGSQIFEAETSARLSSNTYTYEGHTFAGWATTATGTVKFADQASYTATEDATLYAVWNNSSATTTYTITFNANGGAGEMVAQTFAAETPAQLSANTYTYEGHTFAGWATTATGTIVYADQANYTATEDATLYAVWNNSSTTYTVTFNANGGVGDMEAQTFEAETPALLSANTYTYTGHLFAGWATTATGAVEHADQASYTATEDATLYAVWSNSSYTVTFNANGGVGEMAAQIFEAETPALLSANTYTRVGRLFAGWATTATGTEEYADQASYTATEDATLYAVWNTAGCQLAEMVYVEGGTFEMGNSNSDEYPGERPVHTVTLSSFYMCPYEVTQAQWWAVMGENPSYYSGNNLPVEDISWYDAIEFCNALSESEGLAPCYTVNGTDVTLNPSANGYRLPTEAQWEYAARGGAQSQGYLYSGSDNIDEVAWYYENSNLTTHPVGTKQPNELGLYDMSGNVWEWCWDWYSDYSSDSQTDPVGPTSGMTRIYRGSGWAYNAVSCRVTNRKSYTPSYDFNFLGIRLVRVP